MDEIRIGSNVLQPNRQLLLHGEHVHLGPRALDILTVLAEADSEIVTKDELMQAVWPDVTVEENTLQVHVTALRKALGEDAERLHTMRGIGYQLETGEEAIRNGDTGNEAGGDAPPRQDIDDKNSLRSNARRPALIAAALGTLLVLVGIVSIAAFRPFDSLSSNEQAPTTLAVLPFQVGGDEEWKERGAALTASLSSNLARVPNIDLASETATSAVAEQGLSPPEIGQRLGVDHFIEGDVLAVEGRLVSQVSLIEAQSGKAIWSSEIVGDRQYPDEFEALMLNRISGILIALHSVANGGVEIPGDLDPRAYEAYLDGFARLTQGNWDDPQHSLRQMQLAASIEPDFAAAHAGIAFVLATCPNGTFSSVPREQYIALQNRANDRALELDPENFMAQLAKGHFALQTHGDIPTALKVAEEHLQRRPDDRMAHTLMGGALLHAGRPQEAINHMDRAITADPFNYQLQRMRRHFLMHAGDYRGVRQSAIECRAECWWAAHQWWYTLLRYGTIDNYRQDIQEIAEIFSDDRAHFTGSDTRAQSMKRHARFIFLGERTFFQDGIEIDSANGPTGWQLILFQYGYVDDAFTTSKIPNNRFSADIILDFLGGGRLTAPEKVRADPRYHEIFEIPRFKAIADYRRERGITEGLPVFPVKPYEQR